jgi:hypothetical protein
MALDSSANIETVTEGIRFQNGVAVRTAIYRYTVGTDGPFTVQFDAGMDTPEAVLAAINAQVAKLAAIRGGS